MILNLVRNGLVLSQSFFLGVKKNMKSNLLLLALLFFSTASAAGFTDEDDFPTWAEEAIEVVKDAGVMTGYGDGSFGPDKPLTRAEAVTLISRIKVDINDNYNGIPRFPDVIQGAWYDRAIGVAANNGWIRGHDDGRFYPGNTLTRAEFAAMLERAFKLEAETANLATKYADVEDGLWFTASVSAMLEHDLVRHNMSVSFKPGNEVSRAEAAWTFAQLLGKPGLIGASGEVEIDTSDPLDSRRVAIKPRDFNANKQGYEIERAAIHVEAEPVSEEVLKLNLSSPWQQIGLLRFSNRFDYRADVESVRVKLRLDANDMGPEEGFMLKFEGPDVNIEKTVYTNGELALTGLDKSLEPQEEMVFKVFIKANPEESFYSRTATGKVFLVEITGEAFKEFVSESRDRDIRVAPVEYGDRDLSLFKFEPKKDTE